MTTRRSAWRRRLLPLLGGGALAGCAFLQTLPPPSDLAERLGDFPTTGLPLARPVVVYWNEHQVPFIEAESDDDAAFVLGLVHAHLRLGQMAVFRRIAEGRTAEMVGPLALDIDRGLRTLGFGRAAPAIFATMPDDSRRWLRRFVDGINYYQATARRLPAEYAILGLSREPWSPEDLLAVGRLAGSDVNWLVWSNLLKLRGRDDWPMIWARLAGAGGDRAVPRTGEHQGAAFHIDGILSGLARSGSNSLAIAPTRTRTGGAILASDPHLGLTLPNTWLLAGLKSPSYHAVGLMPAGLPIFAIGRNPHIAWGGTNMRAASSDLVDVSALPTEEKFAREETIRVRWWFDRTTTVRTTRFGPILSDAPQMRGLPVPEVSLRWTGHEASDEITAMLAVARAQTFDGFRAALAGFAAPGQNMLYADAQGNIGQVLAVRVPVRTGPPDDLIVSPAESDASWRRMLGPADLPATLNPERGFIASANNKPTHLAENTTVGWFFSPDDRVRRMAELVSAGDRIGIEDITAMQRDVRVVSSATLARLFVTKISSVGIDDALDGNAARVLTLMATWDGDYRADAQAPVAFELFRVAFMRDLYQARFGEDDWSAFAGVGRINALLMEDIAAAPADALAARLRHSLDAAASRLEGFPTWGDMHRLQLRHPLAAVPVVGKRYVFADHPIGGSSDSLMKTAHAATDERHRASYGANARSIADLSDMDRSWFVLLGGQDGWLNSSTFLDQAPLWLDGQYIEMPLRHETVQAQFRRVMILQKGEPH
ncbi:MAG: penicillin acylase family protein [Rhodospirillales bacterium]|nr:penicillin acylase family protein [Rhodospirillales bacterium]